MVQFAYSAYVKKSSATTVSRKGLREGYVLYRWFVLNEMSRLSWLHAQQNKTLKLTAIARHVLRIQKVMYS
jgi:hypothetical protein